MERQLKHHEKKLLKKVNFLDYKRENTARENAILRRYMVQRREDYIAYAILALFERRSAFHNPLANLDFECHVF